VFDVVLQGNENDIYHLICINHEQALPDLEDETKGHRGLTT